MIREKIGIMGGTFDPIHIAHLMIADEVRDSYGLDRVIFIPAANPPHKKGGANVSADERLAMVKLAIADNPHFEVSTMEMERQGPSYSLLTFQELKAKYGDSAELYFITGSDSINDLSTWYHPEELLELCYFVGTTRPGAPMDKSDLEKQFGALADKIKFLAVPELAISSTDIRARVAAGRSIKYLVPAAVEDYIKREGLYRE